MDKTETKLSDFSLLYPAGHKDAGKSPDISRETIEQLELDSTTRLLRSFSQRPLRS